MTECLETFAAVVGSHSAVPDSSEGEVSVGGLYDGVVDTGSARCGVLYHVACPFFAAGKVVEGEGFSRSLTYSTQSSMSSNGSTGSMGPKISSVSRGIAGVCR